MREIPEIDELLNGFIDAELTPQQHSEVERMLRDDPAVAARLGELHRCRDLVSFLPFEQAPAATAEKVQARLDAKSYLRKEPLRIDARGELAESERRGARDLFVRRMLAAAAMVGLIAVLAAVVYTIVVSPQDTSKPPIADEDWTAKEAAPVAQPEPVVVATGLPLRGRLFSGRLELRSSNTAAVDAFVRRAIEDAGLSGSVSPVSGETNSYVLTCGRAVLGLLVTELESIWPRLDDARLLVEDQKSGSRIVIEDIQAKQVVEIIDQSDSERCIEAAKDFAVLNKMKELMPGREVAAVVQSREPDLTVIPKPVLTSSEKKAAGPIAHIGEGQPVTMTIIVVGGE